MRCKLCGQFVDAVIVWLSQPREDGSHAIRMPLCLGCTESIDKRSTCRVTNKALIE